MAIRDGGSLYGPALRQRDAGWTIHHPTVREGITNDYPYPPALAMVLVPFVMLPDDLQKIVWLSGLFGCLVATGYVLSASSFRPGPRYRHAVALVTSAMLVLFAPIRLDLHVGQIEPVLLLFVSLSFSACLARRDRSAGLWLGLALVVKPTFALLIVFLLWKRAYNLVAFAGGVAAAGWMAGLLVIGVGGFSDWVSVITYWSTPTFAVTPGNQSPYGLLLRLFTVNPFTIPIVDAPWLAQLIRSAVVLGTLVVLAVTIGRSRTMPAEQQALEYGFICVAMLLISPVSEHIHYGNLAISLLSVVAAAAAMLTGLRSSPDVPSRVTKTAKREAALSRVGALLLGALAIYGYISWPATQRLMMASFEFYDAPLHDARGPTDRRAGLCCPRPGPANGAGHQLLLQLAA